MNILPDFVITIKPSDAALLAGDVGTELLAGKWQFSGQVRAVGFDKNPGFHGEGIENIEVASVDTNVSVEEYGDMCIETASVKWEPPPPETKEEFRLRCLEAKIRIMKRNEYLRSIGCGHLCRDPRYFNLSMFPESCSPSGHINIARMNGGDLGTLFTFKFNKRDCSFLHQSSQTEVVIPD